MPWLLAALLLQGCATTSSHTQRIQGRDDTPGQIQLSWTAPTTKADGTPISDIAGYRLRYGIASGTYAFAKTVGPQLTSAVSGLEPGQTYYFAVSAFDSAGHESRPSEEVTVTVPRTTQPSLMLTMEPLGRGQTSRFRVLGANPQEVVSFLYSKSGEGEGPCSPQLGGLCVDLIEPQVFGEATADAAGVATLSRAIPIDISPGQAVAVQAVIRGGTSGKESVKTNAITAVILEK